jgi:hypothetical protein
MYIGLHVEYFLCCYILMKLKFSRQIFQNFQIVNFMKICLVGTELFHGLTDEQTDSRQTDFSHFYQPA